MDRRAWVGIGLAVLAAAVAGVSCAGPGGKKASLVSSYMEKVDMAKNQAKAQVIKAAVAAFTLEYNRPPDSLKELVDKGYIGPEGIVDSQGNEMPFSPEGYAEDAVISKSCGACGKSVSRDSQVGDRCPHCGVVWGSERRITVPAGPR